jgi:hypothetical protein
MGLRGRVMWDSPDLLLVSLSRIIATPVDLEQGDALRVAFSAAAAATPGCPPGQKRTPTDARQAKESSSESRMMSLADFLAPTLHDSDEIWRFMVKALAHRMLQFLTKRSDRPGNLRWETPAGEETRPP